MASSCAWPWADLAGVSWKGLPTTSGEKNSTSSSSSGDTRTGVSRAAASVESFAKGTSAGVRNSTASSSWDDGRISSSRFCPSLRPASRSSRLDVSRNGLALAVRRAAGTSAKGKNSTSSSGCSGADPAASVSSTRNLFEGGELDCGEGPGAPSKNAAPKRSSAVSATAPELQSAVAVSGASEFFGASSGASSPSHANGSELLWTPSRGCHRVGSPSSCRGRLARRRFPLPRPLLPTTLSTSTASGAGAGGCGCSCKKLGAR